MQKTAKIQKAYKKHFLKKTEAALTIQKFIKNYQKKVFLNDFKEDSNNSINSSINDSYPLLHTAKRSLLKPSQTASKIPEETFKPKILNYSRTLAKKKESKLGNDLSVEKRLEIMELLKKNKIDELRKFKIEKEKNNLKTIPSINKSQEFNTSFLERQEIKSQQIRMKRETEFAKKQSEEGEKLTFKPTLCKYRPNRSVEKSISDLHAWAQLKKSQLGKAQKEKAEEEIRSLSPFRLSNRSRKIIQQREKKINENDRIINEFKETVAPYWPNQSPEKF